MSERTVLAPPGAGLPAWELMWTRFGFGVLRRVLARHQSQAWMRSETEKVLAIARGLSSEALSRQVLIPRLAGLEGSSRDWSAAMVLQHLVIVDSGIGALITALSEDVAFGREVRIADVKPTADAGREQLDLLEQAVKAYQTQLAAIPNLQTVRRHGHPWFGALNGHGWHTLAALHTMIHRRQLEAVVRSLKASA